MLRGRVSQYENLLLAAGHDLEVIQRPVRLDVADGGESYTLLNGKQQVLKAGDMMMAWVHVPEGKMPEFIGLCMAWFGLA